MLARARSFWLRAWRDGEVKRQVVGSWRSGEGAEDVDEKYLACRENLQEGAEQNGEGVGGDFVKLEPLAEDA